jgi:SET domain-containing protein
MKGRTAGNVPDLEHVAIKQAQVGRGVFATSSLEAEELIGEVRGRIIDDPDYSSDYCIDLGKSAVMEPDEPFCLLNHSCEPNCELILWGYRVRNGRSYARVWLQTLCPIAAGQQLTIDYGWPASAAIPCRCGSVRCRGWIVNPEELPELTATAGVLVS